MTVAFTALCINISTTTTTVRHVDFPKKPKKRKKKKTVANWLFARTTHVAVPKSKFACRVVSGVYFYISCFIKIGSVVLPLWVVENRPSPLLWPFAYTTACTTVQAVIVQCYSPFGSIGH